MATQNAPASTVLAIIAHDMRRAMQPIVRDPDVMQWVGDGKAWHSSKLWRFFEYCQSDNVVPPEVRQNFYWAVMNGGALAGVVGVHPATYDGTMEGKMFLTIFLDRSHQRRGLGSMAVKEALAKFWELRPEEPVHIDTRTDNAAMLRVAEKAGGQRTDDTAIRGKPYARFVLVPPAPHQ